MLTARDLVAALGHARLVGNPDTPIRGITHDSRSVRPGDLFACLCGHRADGRSHVGAAVDAGAVAVLLEPPAHPEAAVQILVPSAREALAGAARAVYGRVSDCPVVAITGTNGKTTVAYLVTAILRAAGFSPALAGSIERRLGAESVEAANTTPEADDLFRFWAEARQDGADALVMEASSHGLLLHRSDGIGFVVGVFTNLTRDHLDYHPDLAAYRGAKTRLFGQLPRRGAAVICRDDPAWEHFARATSARRITYGVSADADVRADRIDVRPERIQLEVVTGRRRISVDSPLYGRFNVANLLAAAAVGTALRLDPAHIAAGLSTQKSVPGRAERIDGGQPFVVLNDFAHTPDALARILDAARELTRGALHVVFGCGGDRDPGKRPEMGRAAFERADRLTITSDNPRTEDPGRIISQIVAPLGDSSRVHIQPDRMQAIRTALAQQKPGDTLVVAGKGHERYQIIGTTRHRFDDADVLRRELQRLGYGA